MDAHARGSSAFAHVKVYILLIDDLRALSLTIWLLLNASCLLQDLYVRFGWPLYRKYGHAIEVDSVELLNRWYIQSKARSNFFAMLCSRVFFSFTL